MTLKKTPPLSLDQVCQHIDAEAAAAIVGLKASGLNDFICRGQKDLGPEWQWVQGVTHFKTSSRARITYNRYALTMWSIARSQNDPTIYQDAVAEFQRAIGR
jgi:hypothetical protein